MRASTTFFLNTSATSIFINFVTRSGGTWRKSRTRFYRLWKASSATAFDGPRLQKHLNKFAQFLCSLIQSGATCQKTTPVARFPLLKTALLCTLSFCV